MNKENIIFEIKNSNLSEECKEEAIQVIKQYGTIDVNTILLIVSLVSTKNFLVTSRLKIK